MGGVGGRVPQGRLARHSVIRGEQDRGGSDGRRKEGVVVRQREPHAVDGGSVRMRATEEGSCVNAPCLHTIWILADLHNRTC